MWIPNKHTNADDGIVKNIYFLKKHEIKTKLQITNPDQTKKA